MSTDNRSSEGDHQQLSARQEALLRRSLRSSVSAMPTPPPDLPVSLLRAARRENELGVVGATISLIRAQWPVVTRERLVLGMVAATVLVFCAAGGLMSGFDLLLLAGTLPVAAGLFTLLLSGPLSDPAHALVSATRTPFGALVFARTTVALTILVGLSFAGSLALALVGETSLTTLVAAWLGPTVIIAALATVLAQFWRPAVTVVLALAAWAGLVLLAALELNGVVSPGVSLQALFRPGAGPLLAQLTLAVALTLAAWSLATRPGLTGARS